MNSRSLGSLICIDVGKQSEQKKAREGTQRGHPHPSAVSEC